MKQLTGKEQEAFNNIFGDVSEFAKGQRDCRDDIKVKPNANEDYIRGYSFQYEMEARKGRGFN